MKRHTLHLISANVYIPMLLISCTTENNQQIDIPPGGYVIMNLNTKHPYIEIRNEDEVVIKRIKISEE